MKKIVLTALTPLAFTASFFAAISYTQQNFVSGLAGVIDHIDPCVPVVANIGGFTTLSDVVITVR